MTDRWDSNSCRAWLEKEVVSGETTLQQFSQRLIDWHLSQYEKEGFPDTLPWADDNLSTMQKTIKEMGLEVPKRTIFSKIKETV